MSGDYQLEDSVPILFTTRAFATGIPGTLSASTVAVYEDVTATPIETSVAVTEDLNSIVGLNAVSIAALAASGYNAGGHYHVVIEAGTVDSVSVVGEVVGSFSIEAGAAHQRLGAPEAASIAADLVVINDFIDTETAAILADTGELQSDWTDGGRLDLLLDAVLADTAELQGDWTNTGRLDTILDSILSDTGELQTDWVNGGRLDVILDELTVNVDALETDTQDIQTKVDKVPLSDGTITWNSTALGSINAEADTALTDYDAPTRAELTTDINSVLNILQGVVLEQGTIGSTGNSTTTIHLDGFSYADDEINGYFLVIFDNSTSEYHTRRITDYAGAIDLATVATLPFTPENAVDTFWLLSDQGEATVAEIVDGLWDEDATAHQTGGTFGQAIGDPGANTETMYDAVVTDATGTNVAADVVALKAETVLIVADTNELQSDDIPSTLSTLSTDVATVDTVVDGIQTDLSNPTDGLGALKLLIDTVDTVVDAVKVKTDSLTYTSGTDLDCNIQKINDVVITGDGGVTPFDV